MTYHFPFENSYARLPDRFFSRVDPTPVSAPHLIKINRGLAGQLGLDADWLGGPEGVQMLSGQSLPGSAQPIALAYAGHQFGNFVPQLGDGRAVLLGEVLDKDGRRFDIQLKGSGPTKFSRRGDGRAALGPVLREYVVSEAMAALGIRTTRALAAVLTGDTVVRETLLPGAVLTRVASSHIRVGTFQFFAAREDTDGLRVLADYVIDRHYPQARDAERPYRALLDSVVAAQAELIARWLLVGFIHGVMNTDNCSIAGETIDFGPCAFMDTYDPAMVFSSIDQAGRYAYANQPRIGHWNVTRLAEAMLPLLAEGQDAAIADAQNALEAFAPRFEQVFQSGLRRKLGLFSEHEADLALATSLLALMSENLVDFTLFFRRLGEVADGADDEQLRSLFVDPTACDRWLSGWRDRLAVEPGEAATRCDAMRRVNPAFIPRNHRIEAMIAAAVERQDFAPFEELIQVLSRPFEDQPEFAHYAEPPAVHERVLQTFCGT